MIHIVAFLIEHFSDIHACPAGMDLGIMLEDAGFAEDEIGKTLMFIKLLEDNQEAIWLHDSNHHNHLRVYHPEEADALGAEIMGFLHFMSTSGALNMAQREFIIHALMHLPIDEISLETAKMLALLILWAQQSDVPELIGNELIAVLPSQKIM